MEYNRDKDHLIMTTDCNAFIWHSNGVSRYRDPYFIIIDADTLQKIDFYWLRSNQHEYVYTSRRLQLFGKTVFYYGLQG